METAIFSGIYGETPLEEFIVKAAQHGYDAVEVRGFTEFGLPVDTPNQRVKEVGRVLDANGIKMACLYAALSGRYVGRSEAECRGELDALKRFVEIAHALDCEFIDHEPGGKLADAGDSDWAHAAEWMSRAADIAAEADKRLVMEIHHGGLCERVDTARRLLAMIDRPNVGLTLDLGNLLVAGRPFGAEVVRGLGNHIFHVHIKDMKRRDSLDVAGAREIRGYGIFTDELLGDGDVDHRPALRALKDLDFQGYLSCECHKRTDPEDRAVHELRTLREYVAEL